MSHKPIWILTTDSPYANDAQSLADQGVFKLYWMNKNDKELPFHPKNDHRILFSSSAPTFFLKDLLLRAENGRSGAVDLLIDGQPPNPHRIGFRHRPFLQSIHIQSDSSSQMKGHVWPAPIKSFNSIIDLAENLSPQAVTFQKHPCNFPQRIQIQTTTVCKANCEYCPKSTLSIPEMEIDEALYDSIIAQCSKGDAQMIELYLHAEPLQDLRLERLASKAKGACPQAFVCINTHEKALSLKRAQSLAESGLDGVFISVNVTNSPDEADLFQRLKRIALLTEPFRKAGKPTVITSLANLFQPGIRSKFRRICKSFNLPLEAYHATTRLGDANIESYVQHANARFQGICHRPFVTGHIRANGDMILCCEDWRYRSVLGNVTKRSIEQIWKSSEYQNIRQGLIENQPVGLCKKCEWAHKISL